MEENKSSYTIKRRVSCYLYGIYPCWYYYDRDISDNGSIMDKGEVEEKDCLFNALLGWTSSFIEFFYMIYFNSIGQPNRYIIKIPAISMQLIQFYDEEKK